MNRHVLIAPLDWGLGHATRCIPIIRFLLNHAHKVTIAGSGASLKLLKEEFPALTFYEIEPYAPEYPLGKNSMVWKMITQLPKFFQTIKKENQQVESIVEKEKIDLIISDNRYGCWSAKVPCAFITHQSNILMPKRFGWMQGLVRRRNRDYMEKFTHRWIPDFAGGNTISGELNTFSNDAEKSKFEFIGPLSRFKFQSNAILKYDVVAIFSGPEPQRSVFEKIVTAQLQKSNLRFCIVRGDFSAKEKKVSENVFNYLASEELENVIASSSVVIARSGYSTIMDLAVMEKKAILVPTPGQTEQEYLAKALSEKKIAVCVDQQSFDLDKAMKQISNSAGFKNSVSHANFHDALKRFLKANRS